MTKASYGTHSILSIQSYSDSRIFPFFFNQRVDCEVESSCESNAAQDSQGIIQKGLQRRQRSTNDMVAKIINSLRSLIATHSSPYSLCKVLNCLDIQVVKHAIDREISSISIFFGSSNGDGGNTRGLVISTCWSLLASSHTFLPANWLDQSTHCWSSIESFPDACSMIQDLFTELCLHTFSGLALMRPRWPALPP